jgi:hypothetical protein
MKTSNLKKKNGAEISEKIFRSGTFYVGRSATTNKQYFILGPINFHQSGNFNQ